MHVLHSADRDALQVYCEMYGTWVVAQEAVAKGILMKGRGGNPVTNPAWRIARDAPQLVMVLGEAFGFTPAARSRIEVTEDDGSYSLESVLLGDQ